MSNWAENRYAHHPYIIPKKSLLSSQASVRRRVCFSSSVGQICSIAELSNSVSSKTGALKKVMTGGDAPTFIFFSIRILQLSVWWTTLSCIFDQLVIPILAILPLFVCLFFRSHNPKVVINLLLVVVCLKNFFLAHAQLSSITWTLWVIQEMEIQIWQFKRRLNSYTFSQNV